LASKTVALLKSVNGGATWSVVGTPLTANLSNPTTASSDCNTLDMGHGQSWYTSRSRSIPETPTGRSSAAISARRARSTAARPGNW